MTVTYHEDPMPRGAGGSARDAALATDADTFVVADGTSIPNIDLARLLLEHQSSGAAVTVVVHPEARHNGNGPFVVPSGIYVFERRAFDQVPERGFCDIKEKLIPQLYASGERLTAYEAASASPRVLDASTYRAVNEWMVEKLVADGEQNGYLKSGSALVHREAFVSSDAALIGPVLVGPGARILSGAVVIGPTSIGRDATVDEAGLVSRSAVWRRSTVGERAVADQSILADDAFVAPGTHASREVVTGSSLDAVAPSLPSEPVRSATRASRRATFDVGTRLGRLVFGASWSRSPAAQ
jgi:NDP-sugar pyrophosphorylase family protein